MSADAKREAAVDGFASMTLEAGGRLGRYRILGLLGRGGMADVYRAEDERLGREVALKLVPPEFARDPDRVERFEREVRAAAKLTHANIVTVHEFDREGSQPFYTMALMRGGDLKARIRSHPGMPPEEVRKIAAALARALAYAHGRGFVHRDVKPENVLFDEDGVPQLTDFGIARAMSSGTRMTATGMSIGSPHYMSPEQARGQAVDGRSDLYSLGVVLYEMLTGRVPFDAADTLAVAYSHVNDPAPALPRHLAGWQPLLDRLLAKSPGDRYGSAGELAEILASGALPQTLHTPRRTLDEALPPAATRVVPVRREVGSTRQPKEVAPQSTETAQSRPGLVAVLAGGGLALVVVGLLYFALRGPEGPERLASNDGGGGGAVRTGTPLNRGAPVGSDDQTRDQGEATAAPVLPLAALEEQALGLDRLTGVSRVFDGMEFVWVPPGEFRMGSTSSEADANEQPVTQVRISRGFWLGKYEVTQEEWQAVMGSNPSRFAGCGNCPVERVSWDDAQQFIQGLNAREGPAVYRLPTEAEWEYAARAGTTGDRYGNLDAIAWYGQNSGGRTHPVGGKPPNAWGLHDMLGSVWEWVHDWYGATRVGR